MELSNDINVLKDLVTVLLARIEALESEVSALRAENAELRSRLNLNSKNSHKPPSSDGFVTNHQKCTTCLHQKCTTGNS